MAGGYRVGEIAYLHLQKPKTASQDNDGTTETAQSTKGAVADILCATKKLIGRTIPGINKKIVDTGKRELVKKDRWAVEIQFSDGTWACCYESDLMPVKTATGITVLRFGDRHKDTHGKAMLNIHTAYGRLCVYAHSLSQAGVEDINGTGKKRPITHIFKSRPVDIRRHI